MLIAFIFVKVLADFRVKINFSSNFTTETQRTRRYTEIIYKIPPGNSVKLVSLWEILTHILWEKLYHRGIENTEVHRDCLTKSLRETR